MKRKIKPVFEIDKERSHDMIELLYNNGFKDESEQLLRACRIPFKGKTTNGIQCKSYSETGLFVRWSKEKDFEGLYRWELVKEGSWFNEIKQVHEGFKTRKEAKKAALEYSRNS